MASLSIFSLGFRGHVNPFLGVAKELVRRGHRVVWHAPSVAELEILRTGAHFVKYASTFDSNFVFPRVKSGSASPYHLRSLAEARHVLPQVLRAPRPDAVLYDGACLTGRLAGEILSVPTVKLCPSYASTESYSPFEAGRKAFLDDKEMMAAFREENDKLVAEYPVRRADISKNHAEDLNIVFMPKTFHPGVEAFDSRFVFVGPCLRDETATPELPPGREKLAYLSLGTLNNDYPEIFQSCAQAFLSPGWRVVMTIGERVDDTFAKSLPKHFVVKRDVPQLAVLASASVFLSQSGMNSVQEALTAGVPIVSLPTTEEQRLTSRRLEELELGLTLGERDMREAAELAEKLRENAAAFSRLSRESGGAPRAAEAIERFAFH